jgi:hypothetical protein
MNYRMSGLLGAAASLALVAAGTSASATPVDTSAALAKAASQAYPGEGYTQYYGRGYGRGGYYGGRGYYRGGRGRGYGGAAAAGIAGLAAGALIGGAIASSQAGPLPPGAPVGNVYGHDPRSVEYCASRYRSYDPASSTFLANDGMRYSCP